MKEKKGFTLIEVIVALSIFMVVTIALLSSYYSYYSFIKDLRYKSTGQNLAQLQLEDIQGLSITIIDSLIHTPGFSFPTDLTYDEPNYPSKIPNPPPTGNQFYVDYGTGYSNVYDSIRYDSNTGKYYLMDGSFQIEHIRNICGVESETGTILSPPPEPTLPSDLLLPSNIEIKPVLRTDTTTGEAYYDFTVILHKEVFPHYQKRIIIIDKTPTITDLKNKIYEIRVIVYWTLKDGTMKSITVTGEKSYARQEH